jgi:thiol-disulfide isomerase/thioredoxin
MKRVVILIIVAITIFSCNSQKKDLLINLHPENGYGVFMPGNKIIFPNNDSIEYKGVPNEIKEFVVRSMSLQSSQYYWELYKKGKIDKEVFLNVVSRFQIDTTNLDNISYDCQVLILIGTNKKEKRVIIIDSDNDEDFSNEKILEYEFPLSTEEQKKTHNILPIVLTSYEYYYEGNVLNKSIELMPSPYKGTLDVRYNTNNETEKKYDLFISVPKYRKGEIAINNTKYEVFVSNRFTSSTYSTDNTSIFISSINEKTPSELDGDIPYKIGDIINLKEQDYKLDTISIWGDTIKLKYLGKNSHPTGITEGKFIPEFVAKKLDNSVFSLAQYPHKYILIDFWGTWCNPCITLIPELKEIKAEFEDKNFTIVSVAYDRDAQKVLDFVEKEQMNWDHVFVSQTQTDKNSLVEKLKVTSFPTTILIAPDGKIIARNKSINELKEILKKTL